MVQSILPGNPEKRINVFVNGSVQTFYPSQLQIEVQTDQFQSLSCDEFHAYPTLNNPAYVYEIEMPDPLPDEMTILDPVKEIAKILLPPAMGPPYQHDGSQEFLLGVVDPRNMGHFLVQQATQPPSNGGTPRPPNLTLELETLVRALRDAELLAYSSIPANCVQNRFDVY